MSVGAVYRAEHIPDDFPLKDQLRAHSSRYYNGGTMIVGPDGGVMAGPLRHEEEILVVDLDLDLVRRHRQNFDPAGHYSRPDVLDLSVENSRRQ